MDDTILLGLWSVDERFGPGAMEDVVVFFRGDGRGCYARENLAGVQGCVFRWWLSGSELHTVEVRGFSSPLGSFEPLAPSDGEHWRLTGQAISVGREATPAGEKLVLRLLPAAGEEDAFAFVDSDAMPEWLNRAVDTFSDVA